MQLEDNEIIVAVAGSGLGRVPVRAAAPSASRVVLGVAAGLVIAACSAAGAPPAGGTTALGAPGPTPSTGGSALAGTWTLAAADDLLPDGRRVASFGSDPQGTLMISEDGRYSLQIFRSDRPKFASGDKRRGTPDEYAAAVMGMSSHIGHCAIDPATGMLVFRIDRASYPNWDGTVQQRTFKLSGDELSYQIPATATGTVNVPISVWRRLPAH